MIVTNDLIESFNSCEVYLCGNGLKSWVVNGQLHREDGRHVDWVGNKKWYLNNQLHRIDGPACEDYWGGSKAWFVNGQLHRVDGPAVVSVAYFEDRVERLRSWFVNGQLHRVDGPASIRETIFRNRIASGGSLEYSKELIDESNFEHIKGVSDNIKYSDEWFFLTN
ncbi:hypothetical protein UFOVP1009_49 [uncultured Caudovirales phage]|uniref:Uncharacterized protein n=1 Tax=uncultured Caudovirales phage TaxID=2100421 RepID=A0A6J5QEX5_9CAUD|nr:hypothetical protein UFOVP1009_49 [uncultured Caudovirales phage]